MATGIARVTNIIDNILDTTASNQLKLDIVDSVVKKYAHDLIQLSLNFDTMTNEQKAKFFIKVIKEWLKPIYIEHKASQEYNAVEAAAAAARAAAAANVPTERVE